MWGGREREEEEEEERRVELFGQFINNLPPTAALPPFFLSPLDNVELTLRREEEGGGKGH